MSGLLQGRHARVLRVSLQQLRTGGRLWIALVLAFVGLMGWHSASWKPSLAAGIALILSMLWVVQFRSLRLQNHPNAARLVPGHTRVLRECLIGLWLLLTGIFALVSGASLAWGGIAAVLMVAMALLMRLPQLAYVTAMLPALLSYWAAKLPWHQMREDFDAWQAQPKLASVCAVGLLLAVLLCLLLQDGGAAHVRSYARAERTRSLEQGMKGRNFFAQAGRLGSLLGLVFMSPQRFWTRWLIARARPTPRSVLARAELALGGHWTVRASGALCFALALALTVVVARYGFDAQVWNFRAFAAFGLGIGAMSLSFSPALAQLASFHNSRHEQALLMLVPGMPRGAALNRRLARRQGLQLLVAWGLAMAFLFVLSKGIGAFGPTMAYGSACLPVGLLLWRDWSRLPVPTVATQGLPMLAMVAAGAAAAGLVFLYPALLQAVIAGILLLTLLLGLWRWRRLASCPQAFPAGRLAS